MRAIRHILVGVKDPSARSLPAVARAAQLARACGADLELYHAIYEPLYVDPSGTGQFSVTSMQRNLYEQRAARLEKVAARIEGVKTRAVVEWDYPGYEAIVRRAVKRGADLIVAARHPGKRVVPWMLTYNDWELLRLSPIPVLIVKSARAYARPVVLAAVDPLHARAKPAQLDREILRMGSILADALRGSLHALHASPPLQPVYADVLASGVYAQVDEESFAVAKAAFDRVARGANIPPRRRHLVREHPREAIPRIARQTKAGIIVMGAVSRSGLKRMFIGNTAEHVLDELRCDVLIVKPADFSSPVARTRRGPHLITATALPV